MRSLFFAVLAVILVHSSHGATLPLVTKQTLSGKAVMGTAMEMTLTSNGEELSVQFTAPYYEGTTNNRKAKFHQSIIEGEDKQDKPWAKLFDDRDPCSIAGVHLFLADTNHRITELQFTPSESILRMYWAPYNVLRTLSPDSNLFDASSEVNEAKKIWTGTGKVNKKLLPSRITLVNAANVHPTSTTDKELQYDTLYSITNSGVAIPDLMVLPRYKEIGPRFLFDDDSGYSEEWSPSSS